MPKPKINEGESDFMERCMESEEAKQDFPDQDQRLAFCQSQWQEKQNNALDCHQVYLKVKTMIGL